MGGKPSKRKVVPESKLIDQQLKEERKQMKREVKLLLLGAGESGKTTILKQMKLLHLSGFSDPERAGFKAIIQQNVQFNMQSILFAMQRLDIPLELPLEKQRDLLLEEEDSSRVYYKPIKDLLEDPGVQKAIDRSNEFQLQDSARPFFADIDRIFADDYIPTDQDILTCRIKSTGIVETKFKIGPVTYNMVDVGGQRSERRKWIHCFEGVGFLFLFLFFILFPLFFFFFFLSLFFLFVFNKNHKLTKLLPPQVTAVIFVVDISAFDQTLLEDDTVNRMHEALTLFESICNGKWFHNTSMILFFNKVDLLREKLQKGRQLAEYFPDYDGENEFSSIVDYFSERFRDVNQSDAKQIYIHQTCAMDTEQTGFVMNAVNDIVVSRNLKTLGLL